MNEEASKIIAEKYMQELGDIAFVLAKRKPSQTSSLDIVCLNLGTGVEQFQLAKSGLVHLFQKEDFDIRFIDLNSPNWFIDISYKKENVLRSARNGGGEVHSRDEADIRLGEWGVWSWNPNHYTRGEWEEELSELYEGIVEPDKNAVARVSREHIQRFYSKGSSVIDDAYARMKDEPEKVIALRELVRGACSLALHKFEGYLWEVAEERFPSRDWETNKNSSKQCKLYWSQMKPCLDAIAEGLITNKKKVFRQMEQYFIHGKKSEPPSSYLSKK